MFVAYLLLTIPVKNILIKTALGEYYDEGIKMICADGLKHCYYLFPMGVMVDYKKQVLITKIKVNV